MPRRAFVVAQALLTCSLLAGSVPDRAAQKPPPEKDFKDLLPRIPPVPPGQALKTFEPLPGFRVEQVAAEPLVHSPVAMSFDENGRLYVVEMIDYSEQDKEFLGRIRLLEDTDGDGKFDKSTVFADKLSWPTAVTCYDGGVFVGAPPDLLYLKDTDGDGKADVRKRVFTGFGRQNVQGMMNTFLWGLDNRIHVATSSNGGTISRPDNKAVKPLALAGRNFAFDPRTLEMGTLSGASQHGMSYDDWGRRFVCHNSDHIQLVMFEDRYLARNPHLAAPSPKLSIAVEGPQADVYRISPVEPWRELRTKLRVEGAVKGPIEGGGRAAGYFTGSTGVTIYRGDAWPQQYRGQAFVGDVGSNLLHRKVLEPDGVALKARRVDVKKEFLASRDNWFRPVQFVNGPDGCLYVLDMYREVIEHPASLPPEIKKHLDLTSGRDRGRLYRVVPDGFKQPGPVRLGKATTAELVEQLGHRNGWHRDTAAQLLWERQDKSAVGSLGRLAATAKNPEGRMHALHALDGLKALTPAVVLRALDDAHPRVREHAVLLSEKVAGQSPAVRAKLCAMTGDTDLLVAYQLAFTLGELSGRERSQALARLAVRHSGDRWMRLALYTSLGADADTALAELLADAKYRGSMAGRGFLAELARQIGSRARQSEVAAALKALEAIPGSEKALNAALVRGLGDGLARSRSPLRALLADSARAKEILTDMLASARKTVADGGRPVTERAEAARTLGLASFAEARAPLQGLLGGQAPQAVQLAAVETLGRFPDAEAGTALVSAWRGFSPKVRAAAGEAIFSRPQWAAAFLDAVEKKQIPAADIEPARLKLLQAHADAAVRERANRIAKLVNLGRRQDVLDAYKAVLTMKGDAVRGKAVFKKTCAGCHRVEGVGQEIAPNLAAMQGRGAEAILLNVLDPNREVNPQYVNYLVTTKDGRTFTGMIAAETATSVTLKRAENLTDTVLRIDVDTIRSTGQSIMPEGLEQQIDRQAMADLLAYLTSLK